MFIEVLLKIKILVYKYTEMSGGEVPIHNKENSINKTNIQILSGILRTDQRTIIEPEGRGFRLLL